MFGGRLVRDADRGQEGFALAGGKRFLYLFGGLAAPAVGAESDAFFLVSRQTLEIGEEGGNGGHHVVVEGRGTDGDVFCAHGVGDDVGIKAIVQVIQAGFKAAGEEGVFDGVGHGFRGMPHGIEHDGDGVILFACRPRLVQLQNLGNMFCPDDAVAGADGLNGQACAGGERLGRLHSVRLNDVRVIFARLDVSFGEITFGVGTLVRSVVLTERVVGEEDVVGRHERDHVVRPVHHGGGDEREGAFSDAERFARLDADIAEVAVVSGEVFDPRARSGIDLGVGGGFADERQAATVIGFGVVGDDDVDPGGIDDGGDAGEHLGAEAFFNGIDERDLFVEDEVRVVRGALFRFVAVEVSQVPVDGAYPIDAFTDLHCFHDVKILLRVFIFLYYTPKARGEARDFPPKRQKMKRGGVFFAKKGIIREKLSYKGKKRLTFSADYGRLNPRTERGVIFLHGVFKKWLP